MPNYDFSQIVLFYPQGARELRQEQSSLFEKVVCVWGGGGLTELLSLAEPVSHLGNLTWQRRESDL